MELCNLKIGGRKVTCRGENLFLSLGIDELRKRDTRDSGQFTFLNNVVITVSAYLKYNTELSKTFMTRTQNYAVRYIDVR